MRARRLPTTVPWLVLLLLGTLPLWGVGFPRGHDWLFELVRVAELGAALEEGPIPPVWAPDLYAGFGSPIFLFYAPLFPFAAWTLSTVTGSVVSGATGALATAAVAGLLGMGLLCAGTGGEAAGWGAPERVGIVLLLVHPYVLADLAIRNACAEYLALMLVPFALAGALLCRRGSPWGPPVLAVGSAAVIVSHNLTALVMAALFLALTLGWLHRRRVVGRLVVGGALGLGLSAWFWLPALVLLPRVRTSELTTGKFRAAGNLPGWGELPGAGHTSVGWLTLAVLVVGGVVLLRSGRARGLLPRAPLAVLVVVMLFLVTPPSRIVWREVEPLGIFQFPWRLIGPLALLTAWIGAAAFRRVTGGWSDRRRRLAETGVILLAVLQAWPVIARIRPLEPEVRREASSIFGRESIRTRELPATVGDEYLPRGADRSATQTAGRGPLLEWNGPGEAPDVLEERGTGIVLRSGPAGPGQATLGRWHFPGWEASTAEGEPIEVKASREGALRLRLPRDSEVRVELRAPPIRRWGLVVSALTAVLLVLRVVGIRKEDADEAGGGP